MLPKTIKTDTDMAWINRQISDVCTQDMLMGGRRMEIVEQEMYGLLLLLHKLPQ